MTLQANRPPSIVAATTSWCVHPPAEHLRVFEAGGKPVPDRRLCSLCGELLYVLRS